MSNGAIQHQHHFLLSTPLPCQQTALTSAKDKTQLIDIICQYLLDYFSQTFYSKKLVITGSEESTREVCQDVVRKRDDLRTSHEEADVIMIQQVFHAAEHGGSLIKVVCDDTDVFVLLANFVEKHTLESTVLMEETHYDRKIININETITQHRSIIPSLLPMHSLSGCDTVPKHFNIGKTTGIKVLIKSKFSFSFLGKINSRIEDVFTEATEFIGLCYGLPHQSDMSTARYTLWRKRTENGKLTSTPKLCALPPTTAVFQQNVLRAHFQAILWSESLSSDPPTLAPCEYGWHRDEVNKLLRPVMLPSGKGASSTFCSWYEGKCYNIWTINEEYDESIGEEFENSEDDEDQI